MADQHLPEQDDIVNLQKMGSGSSYKRRRVRGFRMGAVVVGVAAFCLELAVRW